MNNCIIVWQGLAPAENQPKNKFVWQGLALAENQPKNKIVGQGLAPAEFVRDCVPFAKELKKEK